MRINLIVAVSTNNVIGIGGDLPWCLPDDLRRFQQLTTGHPIVMGRLTWESIGRPLPQRQNIVVTRNAEYTAAGCDVVTSPGDAIEIAHRTAGDASELMVIGGSHIYREFLPLAQRIYMTRVHTEVDGDAYFPALKDIEWRETSRESHGVDDRHALAFDFLSLERRPANQ